MAEKKTSQKQSSQKQSSSKPDPTSKESLSGKTPDKLKVKPAQQPKKKRGCLLYLLYFTLFLIVIAIIAGGVIYAANYLGFINIQGVKEDVGQKYELQKYPVVGQYFSPVETNFETVKTEEGDSPAVKPDTPTAPQDASQVAQQTNSQTVTPALPVNKTNALTPADVAREEEISRAERAKRVSRLARLYGEMKPANAAAVMKELDDDTVLAIFSKMEDDQVAKILSVFEAERAARLTEDILRGRSH